MSDSDMERRGTAIKKPVTAETLDGLTHPELSDYFMGRAIYSDIQNLLKMDPVEKPAGLIKLFVRPLPKSVDGRKQEGAVYVDPTKEEDRDKLSQIAANLADRLSNGEIIHTIGAYLDDLASKGEVTKQPLEWFLSGPDVRAAEKVINLVENFKLNPDTNNKIEVLRRKVGTDEQTGRPIIKRSFFNPQKPAELVFWKNAARQLENLLDNEDLKLGRKYDRLAVFLDQLAQMKGEGEDNEV